MRHVVLAATAALLLAGCGHQFDVEKVLKITDVHTGWYDAGIQDGKNKLVPSISMRSRVISSTIEGLFKNHQHPNGSMFENLRA